MVMISFGHGIYTVSGQTGELPSIHDDYVHNAQLHDDLGIGDADGTPAFVTVSRHQEGWPFLAISPRCSEWLPSLGVLLLLETERLFVGCGSSILAYDLTAP